MSSLQASLTQAIRRRDKLSRMTNAMRLVNGVGDHLDGLLIDRYNQHLHVQVLKGSWLSQINEICDILAKAFPVDFLIVKTRQGLDLKEQILIGSDPKTVVEENNLKFEVNLNDGLNCGLFLDMRHNRQMIGPSCKDKKVFNGFSYTCSFGLYARESGAREVVNIDISRKILQRGQINYQLNGQAFTDGEFIVADSMSYLTRAFKKGNEFDVIILDPPSFARYGSKVFQVKRDLPKLMALAVSVLNPKGRLLVSTNYSEISHAHLERMLAAGLNGRRVEHIQRVGQDEDFTGSNTFKESYLAGLWVKFL